ncbi:MAG TPA: competence/damage-inducible protein A [Bacteroidales bacterium]|jgi:nicotinamide-nucleotide amidase|nr:competence/damage-inducible protein A [Bacteroidales bacterium]MBP7873963.1 competence/damage-inducible protein A [Bacteroidales bacterium]MCZ2283036.1 competence/damage-inducible protein A [Bacteroidales bacterium]HPX33477.1 competence/damage-inducible protein A [Bacteroidales bacterium]
MEAEIITIGDELLIGQVVDTNSAWLAEQLNLLGIKVHQITTISDSHEEIIKTLTEVSRHADIILLTGGLGPTKDDVTKLALCEFFDTYLVFNQDAYENVERLFRQRGFLMTEINRQQASIPAACTPIPNPEGTAPGMWFEKDGKIFISMPGVPFEMKSIFINQIAPKLAKVNNTLYILHKTILTHGVGESFLAQTIEAWEDNLPSNIKLAYLPQPGVVRLRLSAVGNNKSLLENQLNEEQVKLLHIISDLVFGFDNDSMEGVVGQLLRMSGKTLSTAESCTGGYIAHLITSIPGSSFYFKGSVVAYSNEVKVSQLNVARQAIIDNGAVSEVVVRQMAEGVRKNLQTDYSIAVTGVAGPDGGSEEKPVGTTWIAVATSEKVVSHRFHFGEHRDRNIRRAALAALNMLRQELK